MQRDERIGEAVELQKAGRLREAEGIYEAILESDPADADALHLLGLAAFQSGRLGRALTLIEEAIRANPRAPLYHNNYGCVLQERNRHEDALAAHEQAIVLNANYADAHNNRANVLWKLGRRDDAVAAYQTAISLSPTYAEAQYNLGNALHELGRLEGALAAYDHALQLQPGLVEAHNNRANVLKKLGRQQDALTAYGQALQTGPHSAEARINRGSLLSELGRLDEALADFDEALRLAPASAAAHNNRGNVLSDQGRLKEALADFDHALRLQPEYPEAHNNRGTTLLKLGEPKLALEALDRALRLKPNFTEAHSNRGSTLLQLGQLEDALMAFDRALAMRPSYADALNGRGAALWNMGRHGDALSALDECIRLNPDHAQAHNNRGTVLRDLGQPGNALAAFERAISLTPDFAQAHSNRGSVLKDQARIDDALAAYRRAVDLDPANVEAYDNYLFCLNYDPRMDSAGLFEAHREWGERHCRPKSPFTTFANAADADRTLRVGLVSADLGRHPTGYFLASILPAVDPGRVRFYCYSGRAKSDDLTERLKQSAAGWRSSIGLSDHALAEAIRGDGIDILVDLSGHTAGSRLTCFGLRPAPVQVTWLGSCHTTGVPAMDYILMDPTYVPADGERWFTETVVRLPDIRWCYAPPDYAPAVTLPPALQRGHITFGSFNNLTKLNAEVIALWARVLTGVPGSQLMLSWKTLADDGECARLRAAFAAEGIAAERIRLTAGPGHHAGVLADYGEVDIALDPFPFSGCLTTCETLWMGVPLVTLPKQRPASRQSLGFLAALGRTEWVAETLDDYVRIATGLAGDPDYLATLRGDQRARVAASPMCDAPRFAGNLEAALHRMWQKWCSEPHNNDIGNLLQEQEKPEDALAALDEAIRQDPNNAEAHSNRGKVLRNLKRPQEALAAYDRALEINPDSPVTLTSLGVILMDLGRLTDALDAFNRALSLNPDLVVAYGNRGNALRQQGRFDEALETLDQALHLSPSYAGAHTSRGATLLGMGRLEEALAALDEVIRLRPDHPPAHNDRGIALRDLGRLQDALDAYDEAVRLRPHYAEAHSNRGNALRELGRLQEALDAHDEAVRLRPDLPEAHNNRGNALRELGRVGDALKAYDEALRLKPHYAEAHNNRGNALRDLGRLQDALDAYDQALRLRPGYAEAHSNRGNALRELGRPGDALRAYDQALRLRPDYPEAHSNRGNALKDEGRIDDALAAYRRAVDLDPANVEAYDNYLFCLNYDPRMDSAGLFEAHREWGERFDHPEHRFTTYSNAADPDRTLRVGLVSADLARHPTGYFLDSVLPAVDPDRVRFYCYSGRAKSDDLTERLKQSAAGWRSSIGLSDHALAEAIRDDGIDILIDLSGHTAGSRLTCFGLRPAPVQVTWLGSCHTTGVPAMDYILMDPTYVPADGERWFTETVVRLPDIRWCYAPPDYAPAVTLPPALQRGHITFGSFNNLTKLNADVIALWSRILGDVPDAQLMLSWKTLADDGECARLREAFETAGVSGNRIRLTAGPGNHAGVLADYGEVDIALDPFPFSGCLSTCETLWMGVPLVTLPKQRPASRQSLGFLTALGRTEWVAETPDDYVRIATGLAGDPDYLATLRGNQRARVAASPMCDAPRFAGNLEAALHRMWQKWCSEQKRTRDAEMNRLSGA